MRTLLCVAPAEYRAPLARVFRAGDLRVRFRTRTRRGGTRSGADVDPWGVAPALNRVSAPVDGVLLVAPVRESAATALPGPHLDGVPAGVVFSRTPDDLEPWLAALRAGPSAEPVWSVLAMGRRSYVTLARRFARRMREARPGAVRTWWGSRLMRWELCDRLASGPRLALYVGHGRPHGLMGYQGLRWRHVVESPL
ncbi:MAG TPA: hypothetical protein VKU85_09310, partial [bacterium]|nr:hypothetical protein [bacterium]